jgi:hypothetical protein
MLTAANGTSSTHRRRVASETETTTAGPALVADTMPTAVTRIAIANGYRRRNCITTRAARPTLRSSQKRNRSSSHWAAATSAQASPPMTIAAPVRQICCHAVNGGGSLDASGS